MIEGDIVAAIALVVAFAALAGFAMLVIRRWNSSRSVAGPNRPAVDPHMDRQWRDRLTRLNFLLARIQSADVGNITLPTELSERLALYFGGNLQAPPEPARLGDVIDRAMMLDGLAHDIGAQAKFMGALPGNIAQQLQEYLDASRRALEGGNR